MDKMMELMQKRHSVRQYRDQPIPDEIRKELNEYTAELNSKSGLNIQILYDEPDCFNSTRAHYGRFENCSNYISMVAGKTPDPREACGYYGELLVLKAQELGLNTCWVALTHGKSRAVVKENETEVIIISLGYGKNPGNERKSKTPEEVSNVDPDSPAWFQDGVRAALLAPTAINQQKFYLTRKGNQVLAKAGLVGPCLKIDLGIIKCHFELAAGKENFTWA